MDYQKIWNTALSEIKQDISSSSFKTWFGGSKVLEYREEETKNLMVVGVQNNFIKEQLESRYRGRLCEIIGKRESREVKIVFVVSGSGKSSPTNTEPIFSGVVENLIVNHRRFDVLNLNHSFENFVVGESNNIAYLSSRQVADNLGGVYNPFLIYGECGVGKTHLIQAIGNCVLAKYVNSRVVYASAEHFTNDYIESLRNKSQVQFRQKYRNVDLLIVDDVQFFGGKESTQDEFFNTFNELYLSGKQIVLVSDRHPRELGRVKERLISRFLGGMTAHIGVPDLELRTAILRSKCQQRNVMLSDEIINYVAVASEGGAREIEGLLVSVLSLFKLSGGKISLEEIKQHLGDGVKSKIPASKKQIIEAVSLHFGIAYEQVRSDSRKASVAFARQVLMYLLRKYLKISLSEIGEVVGGRDHSTVIYGISKVEALVLGGGDTKDEILRIEAVF